jgi:hypothetical protein
VYAVHILKQSDNIKTTSPPQQATDAVLGMANNLNKIRNLEDYVPDWEWNGAI